MTTKTESKRILSVKISHEVDTDPDTSWLGEYASQPTSEYSIDRAHSEDCQTVSEKVKAAIRKLESAIDWIDKEGCSDDQRATNGEAQDLLQEKIEELGECDCNGGDMERGEYRYFNPSFNYVDKSGTALPENTPNEVRRYVRQDYERMESMNRQQWGFIGISATAEVQLNGMSTIQTIRSGGLWGIESDSGADHFAEVEGEELAALKTELHAIGFSKRAITAAFRNIEHVDA